MWPFSRTPEVVGLLAGTMLERRLKTINPKMRIIHHDRLYKVPKDPAHIMRIIGRVRRNYFRESFDCDDYNRVALQRLSDAGYGNYLVMACSIQRPGRANHALLGFLTPDRKGFVFGDSRWGRLREFSTTPTVYQLYI